MVQGGGKRRHCAGRLSQMKTEKCHLDLGHWVKLDWRNLKSELEVEEVESNIWRNFDVEKNRKGPY